MKTDELRERYLNFFRVRGHTVCPSDSLVPANDPTLLFTGAGMNQFKDMFLGKGTLPFRRAASSQKCLRTGDLDNVGRTASHHTFFEMLGNFSFGDYFKREAIHFAWEFLLQDLGLPKDRLFASVYLDDQEAYGIWQEEIGLTAERIFRFGAKDNFWPANAPSDGPNGPCGPCSEIYVDRGREYSCGKPDCTVGCSCSRYVEIWNLVFTQFDRRDGGKLEPLPQKNIDTGMGLERLASVVQGTPNNMEIDIFQPLLRRVEECSGKEYDRATENGRRMRRIVDHARSVAFLIGDGVTPENEGRGYVLRKVLRRAVRDGMLLGLQEPFVYTLVPAVAEAMRTTYPELLQRLEVIGTMTRAEEEKCFEAYARGGELLARYIEKHQAAASTVISGAEMFHLHDTHGYMTEWADAILSEKGMTWDQPGFAKEMKEQKERARSASKMAGAIFDTGPVSQLKDRKVERTAFLGYETGNSSAKLLAIIHGNRLVDEVATGAEAVLVFDRTPFYGESGGQAGDTGLAVAGDARFEVNDTHKIDGYFLHVGAAKQGRFRVGDEVQLEVEPARRGSILRAHSATHILQWALRGVLGTHVEQAGSLVAPDRLRFDFSHFQAIKPDELERIEDLVNQKVVLDAPVNWYTTTKEEARKQGALMFFGEKYGENVRVVDIGGFSKELCGGTHVARTGQIGYFRIQAENVIAAVPRRLEAVTGRAAVEDANRIHEILSAAAGLLGVPGDKLPERIQTLLTEMKALKQELHKHKAGNAADSALDLIAGSPLVSGVRVIARRVENMGADEMRAVADHVKKKGEPFALCLASVKEGKVSLVTCLHATVIARGLDAGQLVKTAAKPVQGGGGGRPDFAQAGGKNPNGIDEALATFTREASEKLGG